MSPKPIKKPQKPQHQCHTHFPGNSQEPILAWIMPVSGVDSPPPSELSEKEKWEQCLNQLPTKKV